MCVQSICDASPLQLFRDSVYTVDSLAPAGVMTPAGMSEGAVPAVKHEKKEPNYDVGGFADFRARATDSSLSQYEKIGFPDGYRAGQAPAIVADIASKLTNLDAQNQRVLDVGAGCSDLPSALMQYCRARSSNIVLVDSSEMLDLVPDQPNAQKVVGRFPECRDQIQAVHQAYDAILVYSVIQYVFAEGNLWAFVEGLASLLAEGGQLLIGDIPNASSRKRFLSSATGQAYHRKHFGTDELPRVEFNRPEPGLMDDSVTFAILARMRAAGYEAFVMPQALNLPMAGRREDILIRKL